MRKREIKLKTFIQQNNSGITHFPPGMAADSLHRKVRLLYSMTAGFLDWKTQLTSNGKLQHGITVVDV
jgi:hypothetical protein